MGKLVNKNLLDEINITSSIDDGTIGDSDEALMYVTIGSVKRSFIAKEAKYVKSITMLVQTTFNDKQFVDVEALMENIQNKLNHLQKEDDEYTNK